MNEITKAQAHTGSELAEYRPQSQSILEMLLKAANDPTVDAAKVETLANLAIKLQDREHAMMFAKDFAAALMEMPTISKRGTILIPGKDGKPGREQGKFAHFEDIAAVVDPILARHNLVISFLLGNLDGQTTATPVLTHTLTGFRDIGQALKVPPDTSGSKNAPQAIGSSAQYAKRYAMCAHLNIKTIGEDTDGRSYPLPDDPMNDRQLRLVAEAEASCQDGKFGAWYDKQLPRDRAWLVAIGVYARLTGGAALPSRAEPEDAEVEPVEEQRSQADSAGAEDPQPAARKRVTPRQWVDGLKDEIAAMRSVDRLDEYIDGWRADLERLRTAHPELHSELMRAIDEKREALENA